jgi:hypothetical protein
MENTSYTLAQILAKAALKSHGVTATQLNKGEISHRLRPGCPPDQCFFVCPLREFGSRFGPRTLVSGINQRCLIYRFPLCPEELVGSSLKLARAQTLKGGFQLGCGPCGKEKRDPRRIRYYTTCAS